MPNHFVESNSEAILKLINQNPLATLITPNSEAMNANHIPLIYKKNTEGNPCLQGHIPRANPLSKVSENAQVLVIFQGLDSYISPNWYPSKATTHKVVPTWNYQVVHITGALRVIDDADWVLTQITELTNQEESASKHPWQVSEAPDTFIKQQLRAVVGIEILITDITAKFKMSQNQTIENQQGVIQGLTETNDPRKISMAQEISEALSNKS